MKNAHKWRRGWDSNPRTELTSVNGLANPPSAETRNPFDQGNADVPWSKLPRKERKRRRALLWAQSQESAHDPRSGKPNWPLAVLLERFTVAATGCHEWTGPKNQKGYGIVCLMLGGKPNTMPAHRLQWMHRKGQIPEGMDACHSCDNPACVNIDHLWLGTPADNIHDMMAKGRQNFAGLKGSAQNLAQEKS